MRRATAMKCDHCDNNAAVDVCEIRDGKQTHGRLCEKCADVLFPKSNMSSRALLTNFLRTHSGLEKSAARDGIEPSGDHLGGSRP